MGIDWQGMFGAKMSYLELILRGTLMYLGLFTLLRVILKRETGQVGIADILMVTLLADAAQNGMAGSYDSVPEGLVLVGTIIFWSFALDWLGYRFRTIGRFVHPPPLLLVRDGHLLRRNMRKELITEEELMAALREQGVEDVSKVREAFMEGDGQISVLSDEGQPPGQGKKKRRAG